MKRLNIFLQIGVLITFLIVHPCESWSDQIQKRYDLDGVVHFDSTPTTKNNLVSPPRKQESKPAKKSKEKKPPLNTKIPDGYQDAKWGMSMEEVKARFPNEKFESLNKDDICLTSKIADVNTYINFTFLDGKLCRVLAYFDVKTLEYNNHIKKFHEVEDMLIQKYGDPNKKIHNKHSNPNVRESVMIPMGVGGYYDIWESVSSTMALILSGDNMQIHLMLGYESNELMDEFRRKEKEKSKSKL